MVPKIHPSARPVMARCVSILSLGAMYCFGGAISSVGAAGPLYVSSLSTDQVLRYDAGTGALVDTFLTAPNIGTLSSPHGSLDRQTDLLVASFDTNEILRFDRDTGDLLGTFIDSTNGMSQPAYLIEGPDENLYIASQGSDEILRYNQEGQFLDVFISAGSGGIDGPSGFAFADDGRLYVSGRHSGTLVAYDGVTGAFDEVLLDSSDGLAGGSTFGLTIGGNGDLYVASNGAVHRFDLDTETIVAQVPVALPIGLETGPNGDVYVATDRNIRSIDAGDNSLSGEFLSADTAGTLNFFHFSTVLDQGDMNGDGVVDDNDVNPFVLALTNRSEFETQFDSVDADFVGDFNNNGSLDLGDVAGFRALVSSAAFEAEGATEIPEPASAALILMGALAGLFRFRNGVSR